MRRFEDILRILSSVLLGTLVRDFDLLSGGLKNFLLSHNSPFSYLAENTATATAIVLIGVYLRNIHASARYDDFLERRHHILKIDRYRRWRISSFVLALLSLFGAPFAGHILAHHLQNQGSVAHMVWPLFLPFAVYGVWDTILCLSDPESSNGAAHDDLQEIARKWVFIDAIGLLMVISLLTGKLFLEGRKPSQSLPPEVISLVFVLMAVGTITADYLWNHRLYFPDRDEELTDPISIETEKHIDQKLVEVEADTTQQLDVLAKIITEEFQNQTKRTDQQFAELRLELAERRESLFRRLATFILRKISRRPPSNPT